MGGGGGTLVLDCHLHKRRRQNTNESPAIVPTLQPSSQADFGVGDNNSANAVVRSDYQSLACHTKTSLLHHQAYSKHHGRASNTQNTLPNPNAPYPTDPKGTHTHTRAPSDKSTEPTFGNASHPTSCRPRRGDPDERRPFEVTTLPGYASRGERGGSC